MDKQMAGSMMVTQHNQLLDKETAKTFFYWMIFQFFSLSFGSVSRRFFGLQLEGDTDD